MLQRVLTRLATTLAAIRIDAPAIGFYALALVLKVGCAESIGRGMVGSRVPLALWPPLPWNFLVNINTIKGKTEKKLKTFP